MMLSKSLLGETTGEKNESPMCLFAFTQNRKRYFLHDHPVTTKQITIKGNAMMIAMPPQSY